DRVTHGETAIEVDPMEDAHRSLRSRCRVIDVLVIAGEGPWIRGRRYRVTERWPGGGIRVRAIGKRRLVRGSPVGRVEVRVRGERGRGRLTELEAGVVVAVQPVVDVRGAGRRRDVERLAVWPVVVVEVRERLEVELVL